MGLDVLTSMGTSTNLNTATLSTCAVCGNKSNPLRLSSTYRCLFLCASVVPSPFSSRGTPTPFSSDRFTIMPTSLACVCTLQLT